MATIIRRTNLTPMMSSIERRTITGMVPPTMKSLTKTSTAAPTKNLGEMPVRAQLRSDNSNLEHN